MNILRNLVIAYLLIGLIIACIIEFEIFLKLSKDKSFSSGLTVKDYVTLYFIGIIKQIYMIVGWPLMIIGYFAIVKNLDIWTIYEMCKKFEDEKEED